WDAASGALWQTLECGANVIALEFVGNGPLVACSTWDGELQLWDAMTGRRQRMLRGPGLRQRALAISRDGARLAAGGVEQQVQVWPVRSAETKSGPGESTAKGGPVLQAAEPAAWRGHGNEIWSLAFSADGRTLASGDKSGSILLWAGPDRVGGEQLP